MEQLTGRKQVEVNQKVHQNVSNTNRIHTVHHKPSGRHRARKEKEKGSKRAHEGKQNLHHKTTNKRQQLLINC